MALRRCKECGKEMSTRAAACPHCGAKPRRTSFGTWLVLVVIGLGVISWYSASQRIEENAAQRAQDGAARAAKLSPADKAAEDRRLAAAKAAEQREREEGTMAYACKEWVRKSLHDPGSAEFEQPFAFERAAKFNRVQVKVRARNAFNAMRLSTFECRIRRSGGELVLLSLQEIR
jgi:hypothetical protein